MNIMIAEGDSKVAQSMAQALERAGYAVNIASDGEEVLDVLRRDTGYALVILDVVLPTCDGLEVVKAIRDCQIQAPVLLLTHDSVNERVIGLDLGADDCLTKPFALPEFLAHVRALLRLPAKRQPATLGFADLRLDVGTRVASRGERPIRLTAREFALLEYFVRNAERVLTRPMILEHVWRMSFNPESNVIDVYVRYLRRKVEAEGQPRLIHTERGVGYVLTTDGPSTRRCRPVARAGLAYSPMATASPLHAPGNARGAWLAGSRDLGRATRPGWTDPTSPRAPRLGIASWTATRPSGAATRAPTRPAGAPHAGSREQK
jgi:DNA-binding response OmpR family regulator